MCVKPMSISDKTKDYLRACGFSEIDIERCNLSTDVLRGLRQSGDDFLDTIEVLYTHFGVDLKQFDWSRHTPEEISTDSTLVAMRWFWDWIRPGYVDRRMAKYEPVTLGMIEKALNSGRWEY